MTINIRITQFTTWLSMLLLSKPLLAADADNTNPAAALSPSTGALVETLLGLLLILGIILLIAWLLKRTTRFTTAANGQMKIIGGLSLGPRERAVLLQVGNQQILVGVTTQNVNTLLVLDSPIEAKNTDTTVPFSDRLQDMMKQRESS